MVIGVVALASVWPLGWALQHRSATALLVIGNEPTKDQPAIMREFPHGYVFHNQGHDGAGIYLMARHPFALRTNGTYLDVPSYRYRRIVYPMVAAAISPGPGVPLIVAMVVTSLLGVGLGAWGAHALPGRPPRGSLSPPR